MASKQVLGPALGLGGLLIALVAAVQAQVTPQQSAVQTAPKTQIVAKPMAKSSDEGGRIFAQNCSRCHNAPEGFSPRISGTIVRHMRVRAGLSQHDAEELLRFFNP